ncbi:unnamed protein product [Paramecium sonneborni]|uniref:Uncharacterized protein n=1 Tax=Paramecium sonneborni TaxID=65129 RepID=A0A8S1NAJ4_9CILI|nr:unnamed protein product [Paramecium sonneborni]
MMNQINLNRLVETPYMVEIIVQVLPQMMVKATEITKMKENFINNFTKMLHNFLKSKYLISLYKCQQKLHQIKLTNEIEKEFQQDCIGNQGEKLQVTQNDLENLEKIDYQQITLKFWNKMEENSIPFQLQISQQLSGLDKILLRILDPNHLLKDNTFNKVEIQNDNIISLVCDVLKEYNLTSFDFYNEFINYYYLKQIGKQKNLGKSINMDRFLHDIQKYSIKLANTMSNKQLTQIQYKQLGLLYNEGGEEEKWLDEFFIDDGQYGSYKKDIRSCSLVQKKGPNFSFVHKSIQEFLIAADLYEVLILAKDLNGKVFSSMMDEFLREQNEDQDCLEMIKKLLNKESNYQSLFVRQQQCNDNIKQIMNLIKKIQRHAFNLINYSAEMYTKTRKYLIQKISSEIQIIEFLKFLVLLTKIDQKFIQSGSNSLNLLVEMKVDLTMQNFEKIKIKDTSLFGANFAKCNLSGSQFDSVNINGINFNGALLFNCKWKNLRINEQFLMNGHSDDVLSVCFSPDRTILASGSEDNSIRIWDIKSGQQKAKLDGHSQPVSSVCFSPDGTTIASGSQDKSIRLWDVKTR